MSAFVIANTVFEIISNAFSRNDHSAHQCFRIKNLQDAEICRLVGLWDQRVPGSALAGVLLVVAEDIGGGIPQEHVARSGLSITYYRNNNETGLVYLETTVQSDEQGLQNLFTLRDSNFLDGSFDEYSGVDGGVPGLMLQSAWTEISGQSGRVPSLLLERVLQIIRLIHPDVEPVPVRRFAAFASEACRTWILSESAKDAEVADRLIGRCLCQLDMFPDATWRAGTTDQRIKRRFELNARHAELIAGGTELDPEEVIRLAKRTEFVDDSGEILPEPIRSEYASLCAQYAEQPLEELRRKIPYGIFEQLFQKDAAGLKLGDRVRAEIQNSDGSRVKELDSADVIQGLNSRLQADAERLLALQPPEGAPPLTELLTNRTRQAVERVATPPSAKFSNPIIQILRVLRRLQTQDDGIRPARIHVGCADSEARASLNRGLFAFIHGSTLRTLAEATVGVPGACELSIDSDLTEPGRIPRLEGERDDAADNWDRDTQGPVSWAPLVLSISVTNETGKVIECLDRVEWAPEEPAHLALFWFLVAAEDSPAWGGIGELKVLEAGSSEDWLMSLIQRDQSLQLIELGEAAMVAGVSPTVDQLILIREQLRKSLCKQGLSIDVLNDYTDAWQALLARVRVDHVPDGVRPPVLDAVLGSDMLAFSGDERRLMLPTQAMRLRWIASYFHRCLDLATSCFTGNATFSMGEGEQYLDWLESLSPHETPPTALGQSGEILYARSEIAWFEDFARLDKVSADVNVDQLALKSIGERILDYVDAHPFKRDGLALLLLLPPSDQMPAELVKFITRGPYADLRISLTVAAPKSRWERIARLVEALPGEERKSGRGRLFPARDLSFVEFDLGADLASSLDRQAFDVSVVTHVLQESVVSQQNTEPPTPGRPGAFDPVLDRPVRLESSGNGGSISIVMRPRAADTALETWGTLVVRANRGRPVSESQPENVDFVELRLNFQDSARVFRVLHERSHWVVTLERHISREQIESVEAGAPDVLSVETGVGSNGLSTLIVSSHSGRKFIEARLAKKLRKLVPSVTDPRRSSGILEELASRVYEETRKLSPHLALQAMGVARVTEEILGLCIARRFADAEFPARVNDGLLAWLSLDEHTGWFGGVANVRADMCRVVIERSADGGLDVDLLVLEGKFRQNFDAHGTTQVERTRAFLSQILSTSTGDKQSNVDAEMWRERFLSAIESVAAEALRVVSEGSMVTGDEARTIPADIRQMFREGNYRLRAVDGLYSVCLWENTDPTVLRERTGSLTVIRSSKEHVLELIGRRDRGAEVGAGPEAQAESAPTADRFNAESGDSVVGPSVPVVSDSSSSADAVGFAPDAESQGKQRRGDLGASDAVTHRGMSQAELSAAYDEVLACFASHNVAVSAAPASDHPIVEGPASILFKVRAGSGVDPRKLFEKSQALKLRLGLEQEQNVTFDIDKGFVTIDVPKRPEQRYFVNAADLWQRWERPENELSVPIGEDRYGDLVVVNFSSSNSPHLLVAGTTGSGKSEALSTMLFGLVRFYGLSELRLLLVDPKGTELLAFEKSPHLIGNIGWDDQDALSLLKSAVEEMQRRYETFRQRRCRSVAEFNSSVDQSERLPWWVIVLDEYADLTHDPQSKKDIEQELKRLAQKARAAGIHVVIATQKPSADVISTNLRSNLPAQLALRVKSGTESRVVLDESGAENLNGMGDALLKADGRVRRVQCAKVAMPDQLALQ